MNQWQLIVQDTPFNFTAAFTVIVEAENQFDAVVTVIDHLYRRGMALGSGYGDFEKLGLTKDESEKVHKIYPALRDFLGRTRLLRLTPYTPKTPGRVIQGA